MAIMKFEEQNQNFTEDEPSLHICQNNRWSNYRCTSIELIRLQTLEFREMPTEFRRQDETSGLEDKCYMYSI